MKLREFIATTIREFLNEGVKYNSYNEYIINQIKENNPDLNIFI